MKQKKETLTDEQQKNSANVIASHFDQVKKAYMDKFGISEEEATEHARNYLLGSMNSNYR